MQTRDLMSFLSGVKCWEKRSKTTVYVPRHNQMNFDYLAPKGFYNTVKVYGLPQSIANLDRVAQTDTGCFIRTAHSVTEPITVSKV